MAKANLSFCFICFLLCIVACNSSRDSTIWAKAGQKRGIVSRTWCIANNFVGDDKLQGAIDYYCKQPGVDCSVIRPGGPCYLPNTLREHASIVLDLYYNAHNKISPYCPFDVGGVSLSDPSHGSCIYP